MTDVRRYLLSAGLALCVLALSASPALAEEQHPPKGSISGLAEPHGMSFDASGNLYVAENAEEPVVDVYNTSNAPTSEIGAGVFPEPYVYSVAVNKTTGVVYVGDSGNEEKEEVRVFKPEGGGKYKELKPLPLTGLGFIHVAVDNSAGPNSGDVYVSVALGKIQALKVYKPNGEGELTTGEEITAPPSGFGMIFTVTGNGGMTVDPSTGKLYVSESENHAISIYSNKGVFEKQIEGLETPAKAMKPIDVAVDPSTDAMYVVDESHKVLDQFSLTTGKYVEQITGFSKPLGVAVQPLAGAKEGYIYVSDGTKIDIFAAKPGGPTTFPLSVEKTGTGTGTVECKAGAGSFEACKPEYEEGTELTLEGTAGEGSEFEGWSAGTGSAASCTGTANCTFTLAADSSLTAEFKVFVATKDKLEIKETGGGAGKVECKAGAGSFEACKAEYVEGTELTLKATANEGSKFEGWSAGTGSAAACTGTANCTFTLAANSSLTAEFNVVVVAKDKLEVKQTGPGSGTVECKAGAGSFEACKSEYAEGAELTLKATANGGSKFEGWSAGTGSAAACTGAANCTFTLAANSSLTAGFEKLTTVPLRVVKSGNGTVISAPVGISCGATCTHEFNPGTVTLEAGASPGYEFAGWIGCRSTGVNTCEVDLIASTEVTAVFLKAGVKGEEGNEGKEGKEGPAGKDGGQGKEGKQGPAGASGVTGATGAQGERGPGGAGGAQGPAGPAGPAGKEGPPGKIQLVSCKKVGKKMTCTTKLVSGTVKFKAASARATLSRHGLVYAAGTASVAHGRTSMRLAPLRRLRPGRYTLTLITGKGRDERIVSRPFTLR